MPVPHKGSGTRTALSAASARIRRQCRLALDVIDRMELDPFAAIGRARAATLPTPEATFTAVYSADPRILYVR